MYSTAERQVLSRLLYLFYFGWGLLEAQWLWFGRVSYILSLVYLLKFSQHTGGVVEASDSCVAHSEGQQCSSMVI